jgi:hypothetical protein
MFLYRGAARYELCLEAEQKRSLSFWLPIEWWQDSNGWNVHPITTGGDKQWGHTFKNAKKTIMK